MGKPKLRLIKSKKKVKKEESASSSHIDQSPDSKSTGYIAPGRYQGGVPKWHSVNTPSTPQDSRVPSSLKSSATGKKRMSMMLGKRPSSINLSDAPATQGGGGGGGLSWGVCVIRPPPPTVVECEREILAKEKSLCSAANHGNLSEVKRLIKSAGGAGSKGAIKLLHQKDQKGRMALHYAAHRGFPDIAEELLRAGAKPNLQTDKVDGNFVPHPNLTPLHYACKAGRIEVVQLLLQHGADWNKKNLEGKTPQEVALKQYHWVCAHAIAVQDGLQQIEVAREKKKQPRVKLDLEKLGLVSPSAVLPTATGALIQREVSARSPVSSDMPLLINDPLSHFMGCEEIVELSLRRNFLTEFPLDLVKSLPNLKILDLRYNCLRALPKEISACLTNLKKIDISHNDLHILPADLFSPEVSENLTVVWHSNPLFWLPGNVVQAALDGNVDLLYRYLLQIGESKTQWTRLKLLVVGEENVGKTTVVSALKASTLANGDNNPPEKDAAGNLLSTNGVDVSLLPLDSTVQFSCWDFGGQEVFYPTHRLFLSGSSMVIIVFSLLGPHCGRLEYWLNQVSIVSRQTGTVISVILVGTHRDDPSCTNEYVDSVISRLKDMFCGAFSFVKDIITVGRNPKDAQSLSGLDDLINTLHTHALKHPLLKKRVPTSWDLVDMKIRQLRPRLPYHITFQNPSWLLERSMSDPTSDNSKYLLYKEDSEISEGAGEGDVDSNICRAVHFCRLSREDFHHLCREMEVDEKDERFLLDFLHEVGTIVYFPPIPSDELRLSDQGRRIEDTNELIVIDPQWLADMMSSVITFKHQFAQEGVLDESDFGQVWKAYPAEDRPFIMMLLLRFDLACWLKPHVRIGGETRTGRSRRLLIPSLLPEFPGCELNRVWPTQRRQSTPAGSRVHTEGSIDWPYPFVAQYGRQFVLSFFPIGLFGRLFVRLIHLCDVTCLLCWRTGCVLSRVTKQGQLEERCLIRYRESERVVDIKSRVGSTTEGCLLGLGLLREVLVCVTTLLDTVYRAATNNIEARVPCPHCQAMRPDAEPYYFPHAQCVAALTSGKPVVFCGGLEIPTRAVALQSLLPDAAMPSVPKLKDVAIEKKLAEGGFGAVYKGTWDDQTVAIKELSVGNETELHGAESEREASDKFEELQREVELMAALDHPCLVKLFGVSMMPGQPLRVVMEYVSHGDLFHYLHSDRKISLSMRLKIGLDIACGMDQLARVTPPVVHRDLRSPNVLMSSVDETDIEKGCVIAKVADFGLAQRVAPMAAGSLGSWQWAAPEVLDLDRPYYDTRADVYAFGIVLWETATRGYPFEEFRSTDYPQYCKCVGKLEDGSDRLDLREINLREAIVKEGLRPSFPRKPPDREKGTVPTWTAIRNLIYRCWDGDPAKRPKFSKIVQILAVLLARLRKLPHAGDVITRPRLTRLSTPLSDEGSIYGVSSANVSSNASSSAIAAKGSAISTVSDLPAPAELVDTVNINHSPRSLFVGPHNLWVGCDDGKLLLIEKDFRRVSRTISAAKKRLPSLSGVHMGHTVWSSSSCGQLLVYDERTGHMLASQQAFGTSDHVLMTTVPVLDAALLVSASSSSDEEPRSREDGSFEMAQTMESDKDSSGNLLFPAAEVVMWAVSPSANALRVVGTYSKTSSSQFTASSSADPRPTDNPLLRCEMDPQLPALCLCCVPDTSSVWIGSRKKVSIYSTMPYPQFVKTVEVHEGNVTAMVLVPKPQAAVADEDEVAVSLRDPLEDTSLETLLDAEDDDNVGNNVWSASDDGTIAVIDVKTCTVVHRMKAQGGAVKVLCYDGEYVWSGSVTTLAVWDATKRSLIAEFDSHTDRITAISSRRMPCGTCPVHGHEEGSERRAAVCACPALVCCASIDGMISFWNRSSAV